MILRRTAPVPQGTARFSRESSQPDPRLRRHGCFSACTPGNRPGSAASALYALTSLSRSSAALANPLISRVFCLPSPMSRHAAPSLRRSRYSFTRHASRCRRGQRVPRLPSRASGASGTLWMALGKLHQTGITAVLISNTSSETQGVGASHGVTRSVFGRSRGTTGQRSFPRIRRFFQGAHARTGAWVLPIWCTSAAGRRL